MSVVAPQQVESDSISIAGWGVAGGNVCLIRSRGVWIDSPGWGGPEVRAGGTPAPQGGCPKRDDPKKGLQRGAGIVGDDETAV